ncbi:MAG: site-specific DNA-methyltransferase [Synergistaceae bacterium]|nr:site-specific DNA-methyltransferase [Synergistaceae bacterium]
MYDTIINGDSLTELPKLQAESVDLIFADPPYWMRTEGVLHRTEGTEFHGCNDDWDKFGSPEEYESFTLQWLKECRRVLKRSGSLWVIGSMQCIYTIGSAMQELDYWLINDIIWHKTNPTPNFTGSRLNNSHETLIWAVKDRRSKFTFNYKTAKALNHESPSKQMGSVWRFPVCSGNERLKDSEGRKIHSTQKPLAMLERIIAISSHIGDLVLDPFAGTMTTAAAAKKLGRHYIMIERNETYCNYGHERLKAITFEDSKISRADFDVKPPRATMPEMIRAGYFISGEKFLLADGKEYAELQPDGKLFYGGKIIDIHTCAALAKNLRAERVNGFDYWHVMRNNHLVSIREIRENYRHNLNHKES